MLTAVTSRKHLPHSPLHNQQTHYDNVRYIIINIILLYDIIFRLLKGCAPGQKAVSHYSTELGIVRNSKVFSARCQSDHLLAVLQGHFDSENSSGMGGITADQRFYDPEKVKNYTGAIRFKDPQRAVPVLA